MPVVSENEAETADHSSSGETAGDHNNFGHYKTKTITKKTYNPTKVTNIKFKELPIKWDDGFYTESVEKGYNPLLSSIDINKTFTLPGKRGRFKIIHEDDGDIDTVIEKPTFEHSSTTPVTQTTTHYYIDKYYGDNPRKTIPAADETTDSSFRIVTIKTNDHSGDTKPTLEITNLHTNTEIDNEKSAVELTLEKPDLISSPSSDNNIELNKPNSDYNFVGNTKSHTELSKNNENNGSQKLTFKTSNVISSFSPDSNIKDGGPNPDHTVTGLLSNSSPKIENNRGLVLTMNETNFISNTLSKDYFADRKPNTHHTIEVTKFVTKNTNEEPILDNTNVVNISLHKSGEEPITKITRIIPSFVSKSDSGDIEPKMKLTNMLVVKPSSNIKDNIEVIPPNDDHVNVVDTSFLPNRYEIVSVQENSETNSLVRSENDRENLKPTSTSKINMVKVTDFSPKNVNAFEVIPLQQNAENTDSSKIERIEIVQTTTNGIKHEEPSSDSTKNITFSVKNNDAVTVAKLTSQINKIETVPTTENTFHGNSAVTNNGKLNEVPSTHNVIQTSSLIKNNKMNVPTLDSQIIKIELAPTVDKTNTIPTVVSKKINEGPSTDGINNITIDQNLLAKQNLDSQMNEIITVPEIVNETTLIVTKSGSKHEVPSTDDIMNISIFKNQNKTIVPKLTDIHKIKISPRNDQTNTKTTVFMKYRNENKLEIIPTVEETNIRTTVVNEVYKKDNATYISFLDTGNKVTIPKMDIQKTVTGLINKNNNDTINYINLEKKGSLFDLNFSIPITKNQTVKPTQNYEYNPNHLGTRHDNINKAETKEDTKTINVSGEKNLRVINSFFPINQIVTQTDINKNTPISIENTIVTELGDAYLNQNSTTETENNDTVIKTLSQVQDNNVSNLTYIDFSTHSDSENHIIKNVEVKKDHANIPTYLLKQRNITLPILEHIDTFTNALPETNKETAQIEITTDETKQLTDEHKLNNSKNDINPTNKLHSSMPQSNNNEIKFRLGSPLTKSLQTNSEKVENIDSNNWDNLNNTDEIAENSMHLEQFENVSASKTMTSDEDSYKTESDENYVAQVRNDMEDSRELCGAYPYEGEASRSSRITYREEMTDSQAETADINNNVVANENVEPNYGSLRSNLAGNGYPLYTNNYQIHPYQVVTGQTRCNDANYENLQRLQNKQVINDQYLQYILNYLTSSSLIPELNAQYASAGQGVERSEYIRQAITTYLQKLGIHQQLSQEQLQYLTDQVQQHETIKFRKNKNHKIEIIYDIDDETNVIAPPNQMAVPNKYYLIPYNNVHTVGVATNQNMGLDQDNVYQHYLQEGFHVNTVNNALTTRVLNFITILRNLRLPEYQILKFVVEVKKYLTTEVLQTFMAECQTKAYFRLAQTIEMIAKQFLPNGMSTRYF